MTRVNPGDVVRWIVVAVSVLTLLAIYVGLFHHSSVLSPAGYTPVRVVLFAVVAGCTLLGAAGVLAGRPYAVGAGLVGLWVTTAGSVVSIYLLHLLALFAAALYLETRESGGHSSDEAAHIR